MPKLVDFSNIKITNNDCSQIPDLEDTFCDNSIQIRKGTLIPEDENIRKKLTNFANDMVKYDFSKNKLNKHNKLSNNKLSNNKLSNNKLFNNLFQLIFGKEEISYEDYFQNLKDQYEKEFVRLRRIHGIHPKKSQIYYLYRLFLYKNEIEENSLLEELLITKRMRSQSGVLVISVIMPPDVFSCTYNCHYCPNDPELSRSYFRGEPTVERGRRNNFDPLKQFFDRAMAYFINGHHIDKVEIIILGGTFSCYQPKDAELFIKMLFYAANTVFDDRTCLRPPKNLSEEKDINENALCKIIGITIETRPDKFSKYELRRFRYYGVTRIQMGVQHTDDKILEKMNRQCTQEDIIQAIKASKDNGFKIDIHLMPDLPGATPQIDYEMFKIILFDPRYQADQWKIYPTVVLAFTKIKEWYDSGEYKPYAETHFPQFLELLQWVQLNIPPWIRVNRIQRDFPGDHIEGGNKITNLRQVLDDELKKSTHKSQEIRSMEVKFNINHIHKARLVRIDYNGSDGNDIFLSHKSCSCKFCWKYEIYQMKKFVLDFFNIPTYFYGCGNEEIIYSFLRLRISSPNYDNFFAESMRNKGKIRELHVYGDKVATYKQNKNKDLKTEHSGQHHGFGKKLLKVAETISKDEYNCDGTCVIAGIGTRNYYRKQGYEIPYAQQNHGDFMVKNFI